MGEYLPHQSVLLSECLEALELGASKNPTPLLADLTFGAGGHSFEILKKFPHAKLVAFDQDPEAIANGLKRIENAGVGDRVTLVHANFAEFPEWSQKNNMKFNGVLMDLGVSSHQFDSMERGFSFRGDAKLDMRMNPESGGPTGADLINQLPEKEIADFIFQYGEERLSRRIAAKIVERRQTKIFETTAELEELVFLCYPSQSRHGKTHPATRTFQALRIAVNDELRILENTIPKLVDTLAESGALAIISFHSLEDRLVKHGFKDLLDKMENRVRILTKKPIVPKDAETSINPRARSAKLRVLINDQLGGLSGHKEKKPKQYFR